VAVRLAEIAAEHDSGLSVSCNGERADLASIVNVLSLGIPPGARVVLAADGPEAAAALAAVEQVLQHPGDP